MTVQNQALSSSDGLLYTWVTASPDWAGTSFPGPGTALHPAVAMAPATAGGGGGVTDHGALTGNNDDDHTHYELARRPLSAYTAASNDAALADARKCITTTRASSIALRIRLQATIAWLAESLLGGINLGSGTLTITAEAGVTLNGSVSVPQDGWWWAKRTAANVWSVFTGGTGGGGGSGDVTGPGSSVDDRIATWDGVSGDTLQDGGYTIASLLAAADSAADAGDAAIVASLPGVGSVITDNTIPLDKLVQGAGCSFVARGANSLGDYGDTQVGTNGFVVLRRSNALTSGLLLNENCDAAMALAWSKLATAIGNLGFTGLKSLSYNSEVNNTGATPAIDFTTGDIQKITSSANCSPTLVAPSGIGWVQVCFIQDTTPRTLTFPGSVLGSPPQPNTVSGSRTFYALFWDGTNYHYVASGSSVTAGNGLTDTAGTFSVDAEDATLVVGAGGIKRAPITGAVTIADGSNTSALANDAVTTAKILNNNVTLSKLQTVSTAVLLGRVSAGTGGVETLDVTGGLEWNGSGIQRAALTGNVTAAAGSNATTIANDAVTYSKIQNVSAARVLLRGSAGGAGDVEEGTCAVGIRVNGTAIELTALLAALATAGGALAQPRMNAANTAVEWFLAPTPVDGGNLTNANATKNISDGSQFTLPTNTLSGSNKTLTLGTSGTPEDQETIEVIVYAQTTFDFILKDGGAIGDNLFTVAAGTKRVLHAQWSAVAGAWRPAGKIRLT